MCYPPFSLDGLQQNKFIYQYANNLNIILSQEYAFMLRCTLGDVYLNMNSKIRSSHSMKVNMVGIHSPFTE